MRLFDKVFTPRGTLIAVLLASIILASCLRSSEEDSDSDESGTTAVVTEVRFQTADDVSIAGELWRPSEKSSSPMILAFHQGGASGKAEYAPIIPRLIENGFSVLIIDQRRGGDRFDGNNATAAALEDQEISYCDVIPDLEAALAYVEKLEGVERIIAWGSSYSATLAAQLAADHPDKIERVLAFSPASGDVMEGCRAVPIAARVQIPALFLRPDHEMELEWVAEDLHSFEEMGHQIYVASPGAHGSSMLVAERVEGDTEPTWTVVLDFLTKADQ